MKAAIIKDKLQPIVLEECDKPKPRVGEVLIRLRAAALNRRDWWIQQGQYAGLQYPAIVGSDGAGTIVAVGEGVSSSLLNQDVIINPGLHWGKRRTAPDKAFAILGMPSPGTLAEFVSVPVDHIHEKPAHLHGKKLLQYH